MNIAICDDQIADCRLLQGFIEKYCSDRRLDASLSVFIRGEDFISAHRASPFHLAFLDIYMQDTDGIRLASLLRETDRDCIIVFTTSSLAHAVQAFGVRAMDYLVKPVTYDRVEDVLNRCDKLFSQNMQYIVVRADRRDVRVPLRDFIYADVYDTSCVIHTRKGTLTTYISLSELEKNLGGPPFLRCHRSYLVNMRFVQSVLDNDFLLETGERIPIRRSNGKAVKQAYLDFKWEELRREP